MRFPEHSFAFSGMTRPCRLETDIIELDIEGAIPAGLNGTLYRVGPDNRFPPMLGDDDVVHGDGMATMLRLQDGHASFKSRYVRTERFLAEERAGRSLFGAYRNPYTDDPSVQGMDRGTANTTTVFHAGKLLALKEDSRPYVLDPHTLATLGREDFGGITTPVVTAHPHFDPVTGEMLMFGFQAKGLGTRDICYFAVDAHGRAGPELWFEAPHVPFLHDFVVTEHYVLFPVGPVITDPDTVRQGGPYYQWDPRLPTAIGVLPRNARRGDEVRWFKGPPRFAIHYINAYEAGRKIIIQGMPGDPDAAPMFPPVGVADAKFGDPGEGKVFSASLAEWTLDLDDPGNTFTERIFRSKGFVELGTIDMRYATRQHRHVWLMQKDYQRPSPSNTLWPGATCNTVDRYDAITGELMDSHDCGPDGAPGEPLFIPRSNEAPEGDGWILVQIHRDYPGSEFHILDAMKLSAGPLARIRLPYRPRPQFHGCWVPATPGALVVND